ncbi:MULTISPECIES: hypothetical protein [Roseovarius]|uniref:hypothetical protein n=1 Tax=Roseovarius TaxID=74030 RepID=UPI00273EAA2C|nr:MULTISPECIES: hypothetical protein [unclassified Roseovarius]
MSSALAAASVVLTLAAGGLRAQEDTLGEVLADHGCVVGPSEVTADDGLPRELRDELIAYAETALDAGQAKRQGEWIVLGPELCTIRPPEIDSAYDITAPVVARSISAVDAYAEFEEYGCFVASEEMQQDLMEQDGLTRDAAAVVYLEVLAEGVRSGQVSFFSDDPLRTPMGFQVLTGECADVPRIDDIRRSQALMLEHFDTLVRDNASRVTCEANGAPITVEVGQTLTDLTNGEAVNAWTMMDMLMLAIGAGWVEGISATERGTPRPPICSYDE